MTRKPRGASLGMKNLKDSRWPQSYMLITKTLLGPMPFPGQNFWRKIVPQKINTFPGLKFIDSSNGIWIRNE